MAVVLDRPVVEEAEHILERIFSEGGDDTQVGSDDHGKRCYLCNDPSKTVCDQCRRPICERLGCAQGVISLDTRRRFHLCRPCDEKRINCIE